MQVAKNSLNEGLSVELIQKITGLDYRNNTIASIK
jgi:hypothetical protein